MATLYRKQKFGHAKVSNLDVETLVEEHVPSGQVPVDVVHVLEVGHALRHLQSYVQLVLQPEVAVFLI